MGMLKNLRQKLGRRVGAMVGGFEGGLSARRLKTFAASRAHVNTLIQAAGADMTARARYLIRNNGYAANAVESWAGNAVGTGIKPSSGIVDAVLKDRVQRLWLRWTDESDAEGLTDFYGQQRRAARELFIAGEVFFRIRPRRPECNRQIVDAGPQHGIWQLTHSLDGMDRALHRRLGCAGCFGALDGQAYCLVE